MSFDLSQLKKTGVEYPPRVLFYGTAGIGKTSIAAEFPNPIFLQTEEGTPGNLSVHKLNIEDWNDFRGAIRSLAEQDHEFKTLVIDTADSLEPIVAKQVCTERGWNSEGIEEPGYGKGYVALEEKWLKVHSMFNYLRQKRNMAVVVLSHYDISKFNEPGTEGYDRYSIRLHKRLANRLVDEMDVVCFMNYQKVLKETDQGFNRKHVHAESHGVRMMHFEERAGFVAKNRFGMPAQHIYQPGKGYSVIAPYLPNMDTPVTPIQQEAA